MAQVINTNILSLNAQRNLTKSQGELAVSLQRLSSGLRINSAKDDAAGLAISERFTTQIRGLNQAIRNANDGISLSQTAEGALNTISDNLQRIRELAVQARNATNSASDRAALDAEVQQRIQEVNRVATQTQFNGLNLLNGSFTAQAFQVGANQGQIITIDSIANATAQALGLNGGTLNRYSSAGVTVTGTPLVAGDLTINGADVGALPADAKKIADGINALDTRYGASATNSQVLSFTNLTNVGNKSLAGGTFTSAVSQAANLDNVAGQSYSLDVGGVNVVSLQQTTTTGSSGGFTNGTLDAGEQYSLSVTDPGGTVIEIFDSGTAGVAVAAADIDNALGAVGAGGARDALIAAGFTVAGSAAGNNLTISRTDGQVFQTQVVNTSAGAPTAAFAGFAGTNFATGTNASDSGPQLTLDAAGVWNAVTAKAGELAAAGISYSGTSAATLQFFRGDGAAFDVTINNTFTTQGGFATGFSGTTALAAGTRTVNYGNTYALQLDGRNISVNADSNSNITADEVAAAINNVDGFTAVNNAGNITITRSDGSNFTLAETVTNNTSTDTGAPTITEAGFSAIANTGSMSTYRGRLDIASQVEITIGGTDPSKAGLTAGLTTANEVTYDAVNVLTAEAADQMLEIVDNALTSVNSSRADLGALQNRFLTTIDNLQITTENLTASRSRIMDADFAKETAALSRAQILQQAGVAMVAQANQVPQGVLQLLQG